MEEIKVNDGGGLFDTDGLIDTLITDCNEMTKAIASGQYIQYCNRIVQMVQKLSQMKDGIRNDKEEMQRQITELEKENERLRAQVLGLPEGGDGGAA